MSPQASGFGGMASQQQKPQQQQPQQQQPQQQQQQQSGQKTGLDKYQSLI
jgi:hypothetical protein